MRLRMRNMKLFSGGFLKCKANVKISLYILLFTGSYDIIDITAEK